MEHKTASSTVYSPPLGRQPLADTRQLPDQPDSPAVQLPPPQMPAQEVPHPEPPAAPRGTGVPVTDGTPMPCRQKNAQDFLRGSSPGVMAQYAQGLLGAQQHTESPQPAPDKAAQAVKSLVEWREEAPYG